MMMPYADPEVRKAHAREYQRRPEVKVKGRAATKKWSQRHPEKCRAYTKAWVLRNPRKQADPEVLAKRRAYHRAYYHNVQKNSPNDIAYRIQAAKDRSLLGPKWAARRLVCLRSRAKKLGVPFDLVVSDLVIPEVCPVFGTPFVGGKRHPQGPSVDRIIPELGYVGGNVLVISNRANFLKHDCVDHNELRLVADYVRRHNP